MFSIDILIESVKFKIFELFFLGVNNAVNGAGNNIAPSIGVRFIILSDGVDIVKFNNNDDTYLNTLAFANVSPRHLRRPEKNDYILEIIM